MPKIRGQGQSDSTEAKERGLSAAFAVNLKIFKARFGDIPRFRYFHFDLNSGCGHNEIAHCIGSPLAFLQAAELVGVERFFAGFVDNKKDVITKLIALPELQDERCFAFHGDNSEFIDAIPDIISATGESPEFAFGTVLCDPNGAEIPVAKLAVLSRICKTLDIFVNWNSAGYKRQEGRKGNLLDAIETVDKKHWVIRDVIGRHQWTLLLGRNYPVGDHKALGFYHLQSPKGQEILRKCHHTRAFLESEAIENQGDLFSNASLPRLRKLPEALAVPSYAQSGDAAG